MSNGGDLFSEPYAQPKSKDADVSDVSEAVLLRSSAMLGLRDGLTSRTRRVMYSAANKLFCDLRNAEEERWRRRQSYDLHENILLVQNSARASRKERTALRIHGHAET